MANKSVRNGKLVAKEAKEDVVLEDQDLLEEGNDDILEEDLHEDVVAEGDDEDDDKDSVDEDELTKPDLDAGAVNKKFKLLPEEEELKEDALAEKLMEGHDFSGKEIASLKESFDKIFENENLTKEFKQKVSSVFEAAVNIRAKSVVAELAKKAVAIVKEERIKGREKVAEMCTRMMEHFANKWFAENQINIVDHVMLELAEGNLKATKSFLSTFNVKAPKSRENLIEKLSLDNATWRTKLDEALSQNMRLQERMDKIEKKATVRKLAEGLSDTDREKFELMAESVIFEDSKTYRTKLQSIREGVFVVEKKTATEDFVSKMLVETPESKKETSPAPAKSKTNPYLLG